MELTIRNGLFEKALTVFALVFLCLLAIVGVVLNHEQSAGFEAGNSGGSIMVSLSSAPGSQAPALGDQAPITDIPEATNRSQAQSTPQSVQKTIPLENPEENTEETPVSKEYLNPTDTSKEPASETAVTPPLADTLPEVPETPASKEPVEEIRSERPPEEVPTTVQKDKAQREETEEEAPRAKKNQVATTEAEIAEAKATEAAAKSQLPPKPLPKPVRRPKPKPTPKQVVPAEQKPERPPLAPQKPAAPSQITPPVTEAVKTPETAAPTSKADVGKSKENLEATKSDSKNNDQRSNGQSGVSATQNTGTTSQSANSNGAGQKATGDYWQAVQIHMARNKRYPSKAQRRKMQGVALVELTLLASGEVESYKLLESTGHSLLDKAVIKMIKKSSPFPPFPATIPQNKMTRRIPVMFSIKN